MHKESQLIHELNLDSLDFIELIMRIEEEYGIDISAENAERLNTAGDLYQYIIEHA
ncbi:acyl carrier protein [Bacteroides xylanisolvens]|nr:acyl carrier protein [Bacteroides xylanisolvens]MCS3333687.1 acyl carrier protein [Bacteroides xylanisolvens]